MDPLLDAILGVSLILLLASWVYIFTKKFKFLPFPVALLFIGIFISQLQIPAFQNFRLTPELVLYIFLPILLFESAFSFEFREFRKILIPAFIFSTIGLIISAIFVAVPLILIFDFSLLSAFLYGGLISSTDPIAVLAIFKKLGVPKKLQLLIDGESFLNDATSVILFRLVLGLILAGSEVSVSFGLRENIFIEALLEFGYVIAGGVFIGVLLGVLFSEIISLLRNESVVDVTLTVILASLVFLISEHFLEVSGIISVLAAGLTLGNYGRTKITPTVEKNIERVWEFLIFLTLAVVFILVGFELNLVAIIENIELIVVSVIATLLARAASVYLLGAVINATATKSAKIPWTWLHIVNWGGLKGVLPVVIVLSLPETFPQREIFLQMVMSAVLTSFALNALTLSSLIKWLEIDIPDIGTKIESKITEILIKQKLLNFLRILKDSNEIGFEVYGKHVAQLRTSLKTSSNQLLSLCQSDECVNSTQYSLEKILRRFCLHLEKGFYHESYQRELISEEIYLRLEDSVQRQLVSVKLGEDQFNPNRNLEEKFAKLKQGKFTAQGIFNRIRGVDFETVIRSTYKYYKLRQLGDERVLEELHKFNNSELRAIGEEPILKLISIYEDLHEYNTKTLNYLKRNHHKLTLEVEEQFFEQETKGHIRESIAQFGEEGVISKQALQHLNLV